MFTLCRKAMSKSTLVMRCVLAPLSWLALSGFFLHPGGGAGGGTLVSTVLSGTSFASGQSSGTYIGTLSTSVSPATPVFSGSYSLVSSGGSCSSGDTTDFQIAADAVETNGTPAAGTYTLCVKATQGARSLTQGFTITAGNLITATNYCAANGGGTGSSSSPWQAACIQEAVSHAIAGDTVYLAAGYWALNYANDPVTISTTINLVGAGSGNTFNSFGNPNNASGTDLCSGATVTITCVVTTGSGSPPGGSDTPGGSGPGGFITIDSCTGCSVSHMFFDGSLFTNGGGTYGTFNTYSDTGTIVNDVRYLSFEDSGISYQVQFYPYFSTTFLLENSTLNAPLASNASGFYAPTAGVQANNDNGITVRNTSFWEGGLNPIATHNIVFTGNIVFQGTDTDGNRIAAGPGLAWAGCAIGPGINGPCPGETGYNGNTEWTATDNYIEAPDVGFAMGGGVNDPGGAGGNNGMTFIGNTLTGDSIAIDLRISLLWCFRQRYV